MALCGTQAFFLRKPYFGNISDHLTMLWYLGNSSTLEIQRQPCVARALLTFPDHLQRFFGCLQHALASLFGSPPNNTRIPVRSLPTMHHCASYPFSLSTSYLCAYLLLNGRTEILGHASVLHWIRTFMNINNWSKPRPRFCSLHAQPCRTAHCFMRSTLSLSLSLSSWDPGHAVQAEAAKEMVRIRCHSANS